MQRAWFVGREIRVNLSYDSGTFADPRSYALGRA